MSYEINMDDERLDSVDEDAANAAVAESDAFYDSAIDQNNADKTAMLDSINANTSRQEAAANANTALAIEQIEQSKDRAQADYTKEQSGAYVDWQKQSNQYGANAEQRAAQGLSNTGYSESSQVAMYNQYQNRIATARESFQRSIADFDMGIAQARAQNSSVLAEIYSQALAQQLEVSMNFAQMNNTLISQKANARMTIKQNYFQRYLAVLDQILKEDSLKLESDKFDYQKAQDEEQSARIVKRAESAYGPSNDGGNIEKDGGGAKVEKNSEKADGELKINTKSLNDAGFSGASAETINMAVQNGMLIEYEKDGELYYKRAPVDSSFRGMIDNRKGR